MYESSATNRCCSDTSISTMNSTTTQPFKDNHSTSSGVVRALIFGQSSCLTEWLNWLDGPRGLSQSVLIRMYSTSRIFMTGLQYVGLGLCFSSRRNAVFGDQNQPLCRHCYGIIYTSRSFNLILVYCCAVQASGCV